MGRINPKKRKEIEKKKKRKKKGIDIKKRTTHPKRQGYTIRNDKWSSQYSSL
jgi:hypothetical protein